MPQSKHKMASKPECHILEETSRIMENNVEEYLNLPNISINPNMLSNEQNIENAANVVKILKNFKNEIEKLLLDVDTINKINNMS